jgi:tellurite resistance protein TehA-like permease
LACRLADSGLGRQTPDPRIDIIVADQRQRHQLGRRTATTIVWAFAALMLVALSGAWTVHWIRHRETAKGYAHDPVMAQFWGAPPMALMTVGDGALLLGKDWIGLTPALTVDWALWTAGTALGLITTVWIPFRMMTTHDIKPDSAFAGWLMPVVPPMVSAADGALLIPHVPEGQLRLGMLMACYAMFGISLFATLFIVPQVWQRLVQHSRHRHQRSVGADPRRTVHRRLGRALPPARGRVDHRWA